MRCCREFLCVKMFVDDSHVFNYHHTIPNFTESRFYVMRFTIKNVLCFVMIALVFCVMGGHWVFVR